MCILCALSDNNMCFQDKHGINTTVENYKDRLISVTPEFTPHVMTFKLLLYANISDQNIYKCVAKMPTGEHCFDSKPVMFHGKDTDGMDLLHILLIMRSYCGEK